MDREEIAAEIHKFLATHHENVECDTCLNVFEDLRILFAEICEEEKVIDWEQRRYEIAKEVLAASFATSLEGISMESHVHFCVMISDMLIEELKTTPEQE